MKWNRKNDTYNEILINEAALLHLSHVGEEPDQGNAELFPLLLEAVGIAVSSLSIRIRFQVLFCQSFGIKIADICNEQEDMNYVDK